MSDIDFQNGLVVGMALGARFAGPSPDPADNVILELELTK
jgi:hypothetical protein